MSSGRAADSLNHGGISTRSLTLNTNMGKGQMEGNRETECGSSQPIWFAACVLACSRQVLTAIQPLRLSVPPAFDIMNFGNYLHQSLEPKF